MSPSPWIRGWNVGQGGFNPTFQSPQSIQGVAANWDEPERALEPLSQPSWGCWERFQLLSQPEIRPGSDPGTETRPCRAGPVPSWAASPGLASLGGSSPSAGTAADGWHQRGWHQRGWPASRWPQDTSGMNNTNPSPGVFPPRSSGGGKISVLGCFCDCPGARGGSQHPKTEPQN